MPRISAHGGVAEEHRAARPVERDGVQLDLLVHGQVAHVDDPAAVRGHGHPVDLAARDAAVGERDLAALGVDRCREHLHAPVLFQVAGVGDMAAVGGDGEADGLDVAVQDRRVDKTQLAVLGVRRGRVQLVLLV